ncbi:hypothetical protein [Reyranella sp.]|uniref:hypothetical protein n=1 Tax=Reyranella sp. TaxID=1929291 RepID=UPI003BA90E0D
MTIAEDLAARAAALAADSGVMNRIVNGPANGDGSIVETEGGPVKTLARVSAEYATQSAWLTVGGAYAAMPGERLYLAAGSAVLLPPEPYQGSRVELQDREGTWPSNPPTIAGNGKSIEFFGGTYESVRLASGGAFVFDEGASLWRVS